MNIKPKTARIIITTFALWAVAAFIGAGIKHDSLIRDIIFQGFAMAVIVAFFMIWPALLTDAIQKHRKLEIFLLIAGAIASLWLIFQNWREWVSHSTPQWFALIPAAWILGGIALGTRLLSMILYRIGGLRKTADPT